ncbi:hypothetical protein EW146_g8670 [Bondarzewia mesenterica]|uniref:Uncharacterized protein n=1 Tax=Bondarzewia mesenterica TaxID=1095465 RepID=A0A4S4LEF3_9AGAM|nr:hypothetical protein EW146_g8670 [Bondarzewia mesenterica]
MSNLSDQLLLITRPALHRHYLHRIQSSLNQVLQYNPHSDRLSEWAWPVEGNARVTLSALRDYRLLHRFLGPCCLCPLFAPEGQRAFTEAAIFMLTSGSRTGQYVAQCAQDECGYKVFMEKLYEKSGVLVRRYPARAPGEQRPPRVLHCSEESTVPFSRRPLKRTYALLDLNDAAMPVWQAPPVHHTMDPFLQLDTAVRPGLTRSHFKALFAQCGACGLVTTRRTFGNHYCQTEVIDLTGDNEVTDAELTEEN